MKTKIFADKEGLMLSTPPHNSSVGNKILHLFFIIKIALRHNLDPVITVDSNLDLIFDCSRIKRLNLQSPPFLFVEETSFSSNDIGKVAANSKEQFLREKAFLELSFEGKPDFSVRGHFYHFDLMPSEEECRRFIEVRPELIRRVKEKYPSIADNNAVGVHYRGSDFKRHMSHIFGSIVPGKDYYKKAVEEAGKRIKGDVEFHLFSDEPKFLETLFSALGKRYITHRGGPYEEHWAAMYLIPNMISSNSSFCWTASLWRKSVVIQAKAGVNYYHPDIGVIPYGFHNPGAILIPCKNTVLGGFLLESKKMIMSLRRRFA